MFFVGILTDPILSVGFRRKNKIPKGPQLKIQRACREAGITPPAKTSSPTKTAIAAVDMYEEEGCAICLERDIEVLNQRRTMR